MRLADVLTKERIALDAVCSDWKEAVQAGCDLLLKEGCIVPEYAEAIIRHHEAMGPYMVVAPGIMFAHARPEEGAKAIGLSLLRLSRPLAFGNETNDPVTLVLTLATTDHQAHLSLLEALMALLSDESDMQAILEADTADAIVKIAAKHGGAV